MSGLYFRKLARGGVDGEVRRNESMRVIGMRDDEDLKFRH